MILQSIHRVSLDPITEYDKILQMERNVEWFKTGESTVAIVFEKHEEFVINDLKGEQE